MKELFLILYIFFAMGCASVGKLYEMGDYTETVCTKKFFKEKVCNDVEKEGLHVVKMITVKGTASKFSFKKGEETGEGATFMPDFSGLSLKNQ